MRRQKQEVRFMPLRSLAATPNCSSRIKTDRSSVTSALLAAFAPTETAEEINAVQEAAAAVIDGENAITWHACDTDFDCNSGAASEAIPFE